MSIKSSFADWLMDGNKEYEKFISIVESMQDKLLERADGNRDFYEKLQSYNKALDESKDSLHEYVDHVIEKYNELVENHNELIKKCMTLKDVIIEDRDALAKLTKDYNDMVDRHNTLLDTTRKLILVCDEKFEEYEKMLSGKESSDELETIPADADFLCKAIAYYIDKYIDVIPDVSTADTNNSDIFDDEDNYYIATTAVIKMRNRYIEDHGFIKRYSSAFYAYSVLHEAGVAKESELGWWHKLGKVNDRQFLCIDKIKMRELAAVTARELDAQFICQAINAYIKGYIAEFGGIYLTTENDRNNHNILRDPTAYYISTTKLPQICYDHATEQGIYMVDAGPVLDYVKTLCDAGVSKYRDEKHYYYTFKEEGCRYNKSYIYINCQKLWSTSNGR